MNPYEMVRSVDADGVIFFTFTAKDKIAEPLVLRPDDYQSGAKMRDYVTAWIGTLQ